MNIFFSGIGGLGMGPLSELALDAGYSVAGSDLEASPVTDQLQARGVKVYIGPQDGSALQQAQSSQTVDLYAYTAALKSDHPELVLAQQLGIKTVKRDELIAEIIKDKNLELIAISGTHGKTTTTGMTIWTLQQLGLPVSYSIGATLSFGPSGKFDTNSHYFVYECDEFDRNFLHFNPRLSLITAIDYDHPDVYKTEQEYLDAFGQFARQSEFVVAWNDQHPEIYNGLAQATLLDPSQIDPDIQLAGLHNRRNATLVKAALEHLGIGQGLSEALSSFPGTDRRFEKLAENLYSDYGHHPVEIAATLELARELSDQVVLVYQPHQNIRQHSLRGSYTNQFELAEEIYWLPTYLSREDPNLEVLTPQQLIQNLTNKDKAQVAELNDELWGKIEAARQAGKLVICMGAGTIDGWVRSQLKA